MNVLLSLCKGLLWLVLLLVITALLTVLAWWMQWPLLTGVAILLCIGGLFLAFLALRALYRWHDKRRFVSKVLQEQGQLDKNHLVPLGRFADAWQQGLSVLKASPNRFQERLAFSQPWFVALDATGSQAPLLSALGETLPETPDTPLSWHFLSSLVVLRVPREQISPNDWQELLSKLTGLGRNLPVRGILLTLSADDLNKRSQEELALLGRSLRTHCLQLMLALNKNYPLFVLTEGLEALPGMNDLIGIVPAEDFNAHLGQKENGDARSAAASAKRRLEDMLRASAVLKEPHGDMLKALSSLDELGEKLESVLAQITRPIAHQQTLSLEGIYFCQSARTDRSQPAFLTGLLSHVLPSTPHAEPLRTYLPFMANTKAFVMGAWLLLTLALCALMGVNVLYQHQALSELPNSTAPVLHEEETNKLYLQMLYLQSLEKAQKAWYLPTFGQDALGRIMRKGQADFTEKVYLNILTPLLADFQNRLRSSASLSHDESLELGREMMWLTAVASDRLKNSTLSVASRPFPVNTLNTSRWNPVLGRLIVNAVKWMADGGQLDTFTHELRAFLANYLSRQNNRALDEIVTEIDTRYPAAKICLSNFWPHVSSTDPNNLCVQPSFTATGYKAFRDILEDIEAVDDKMQVISQSTQAFRTDYFRRYGGLWLNFTKAFAKIRASMQEGDVFISYSNINKIEDMPHYRMLQTLGKELLPLKDAKESPSWLSRCLLMDVVVDIAEFEHRQEATSRVRTLLTLVSQAPDLLQRLRAETRDAQEARQMFTTVEALKAYFDDTLSLLQVITNPEQSYALASAWFGGHKRTGVQAKESKTGPNDQPKADSEDLYANAKKQLEIITNAFKGNSQNPMLEIVPGILDFIAQGVTVQSAKVVQATWENEVLSSATALYRQDDVAGLFGDKGVVQTFVDMHLKPFLTRKGKALAAASWGDIEFPFTTDGLAVLSTAEMIAAQPPEDTYYVELRSQPTLVNIDARERVDTTTLTLQCQDKTYTLLNRNYPRNEKFQYTVKQCATTTLEVVFPSFTLTKHYETFTDFLKDFQYGERDFSQDDFDKDGDKMEAAGVKDVTVRILPDNVANVLQKEGHEPPSLPDRLTYVW